MVCFEAKECKPEPKCCNNNCRQGRDCPNRRSIKANWPLIGVFAFGLAFWAVVIWLFV